MVINQSIRHIIYTWRCCYMKSQRINNGNPIVVEIFQAGSKWWTNQMTNLPTNKSNAQPSSVIICFTGCSCSTQLQLQYHSFPNKFPGLSISSVRCNGVAAPAVILGAQDIQSRLSVLLRWIIPAKPVKSVCYSLHTIKLNVQLIIITTQYSFQALSQTWWQMSGSVTDQDILMMDDPDVPERVIHQ